MNNSKKRGDCAALKLLRSEYAFEKMIARDWGLQDRSVETIAAAEAHKAVCRG